jgi:uncharacterized membrane protein YkvA (DUF1232 family)
MGPGNRTLRSGTWRRRARRLKREFFALYYASQHPRVSWYAKVVAACVVAYAFSPIDLIPDPIPVLGYLDDLVILPLGVALVLRLIPQDVLAECRKQAQERQVSPVNWIAAGVIVAIWIGTAAALGYFFLRAWFTE